MVDNQQISKSRGPRNPWKLKHSACDRFDYMGWKEEIIECMVFKIFNLSYHSNDTALYVEGQASIHTSMWF